MNRKLAIFFPGIGYHKDKPLLYYSRKVVASHGYEQMHMEYHDLPSGIKGDAAKMKQAAMMAYQQCEDLLRDLDYSAYDEILLVGKSIGTYLATTYAYNHIYAKVNASGGLPRVRLILYTPVEATYRPEIGEAIAFIGESDSWSDLRVVKELSKKRGVPLCTYPNANHSLETDDPLMDLETLGSVMELTDRFLR